MLEILVVQGNFLKKAVGVISKIADKAMVLINDKGPSILVRDRRNQYGELIVALRLRKTGCFHYHFHCPDAYGNVGISLARFQEILNEVTQNDSVSISLDGYGRDSLAVDLDNSATGGHKYFPWQMIPYNAQEYPYNAPLMNVDETLFRVTASIPSKRFCDVLTELRYNRGPDNVLIDTLEPVEIYMTMSLFVCQSSGGVITLEEENGFTIEGATQDDLFYLRFPLLQLNAFMEAAHLSDRVFIHAHEGGYNPLLNCPFGGEDLGSLLFIGNYSSNVADIMSET